MHAISGQARRFEEALTTLDRTVADAVQFFSQADEPLSDGHQTASEVLSHLVFWHREYVAIARALGEGCQPELRDDTFAALNALAREEFTGETMRDLAQRLAQLQQALDVALRGMPDRRANFPVKQGGRYWSVEDRVPNIESHIRNHVKGLKRAAQKQRGLAVSGAHAERRTKRGRAGSRKMHVG